MGPAKDRRRWLITITGLGVHGALDSPFTLIGPRNNGDDTGRTRREYSCEACGDGRRGGRGHRTERRLRVN